MNPYHTPYRQPLPAACGDPFCPRSMCGARHHRARVYGQPPPLELQEPLPYTLEDPVSRSAAVTGAVANCLVAIPFVGGIFGIIFGLIAVRKARRGRVRVERSAEGLRGKGAYIAGGIMGWSAFGLGLFMIHYYLLILVLLAANA